MNDRIRDLPRTTTEDFDGFARIAEPHDVSEYVDRFARPISLLASLDRYLEWAGWRVESLSRGWRV